MAITLAAELPLPIEAVTETFSILGRRGSGKTHTASVLAEGMLKAGAQIVVLDPLDVWWGLRSSADGSPSGFPVIVCGGTHGDLPLTADAGEMLADFVVDELASVVLSLRHLSKNDQRKFVWQFCERLYHRKGADDKRTPLHVFIDEADAFAPQRVPSGHERMLGAVDDLVRRGRSSGIGVSLITQRSAAINKDVLSQTEVLIAHQTTSPHDRKALDAWVEANDAYDQRSEFMGSVASLGRGEAWVWSPGWLGIFQRVQVKPRATYDSSRTPKAGEVVINAEMKPVDLEGIRKKLAATIEKAEQDDPKKLRAEVGRLTRELATAQRSQGGVSEAQVQRAIREAVGEKDAEIARLQRLLRDRDQVIRIAASKAADISAVAESIDKSEPARATKPVTRPEPPKRAPDTKPRDIPVSNNGHLSGPEQRILDAIAWCEAIGVPEPEQPAVAFLAGYKFGGGAFNNPRGSLRVKGYVTYLGERIAMTDEGREHANTPDIAPTNEELQERVLSRLQTPEQRVLRPLLEAWPEPMDNESLAAAAGYAAGAGAFNNPKGRLRTLGLIEYPQPGYAVARDLLFPEGA